MVQQITSRVEQNEFASSINTCPVHAKILTYVKYFNMPKITMLAILVLLPALILALVWLLFMVEF